MTKTLRPKNILIRMPNWIGDAVMASPVISDLRSAYPEAKITLMCQGPIAALFKEDKDADEVIAFDRLSGLFKKGSSALIQKIREGKYDTGLLLTNSFSSAWWFYRAGIKNRIGFKKDLRSLLLTHPVPIPESVDSDHLVHTYKRLLTPFGLNQKTLSSTTPRLFIKPQETKEIEELLREKGLDEDKFLIGINPTAAYGDAKCWPWERFRAVIESLAKHPGVGIILFGDNKAKEVTQKIIHNLPSNVIDLAGQTNLRHFLALVKRCDFFLTNDSGPMHIAAALKTPLLALFGSTNEKATGPYQFGEIIHKHVLCSPCYLRKCPIDFRCMNKISVEEVYRAIVKRLPPKKRKALQIID